MEADHLPEGAYSIATERPSEETKKRFSPGEVKYSRETFIVIIAFRGGISPPTTAILVKISGNVRG